MPSIDFDSHYCFASKGKEYDRKSTIQHWQLRDLISFADKENELFCAQRNQTIKYNIKSQTSEVVQELTFSPTSMAVGHGHIAAGGQSSQLDVRRLDTGDVVFKGIAGGSVNNGLFIGKDLSGVARLFVSNNDETVKVYNLSSMQLVTTIRCPFPINYSTLSPDGTTLVCVGDCPQVFVYRATPTGYVQSRSACDANDAGMSAAWNASGSCYATGSQDGKVCIWDQRSTKCVTKFRTHSAVRAVKYSSSPMDLLAFSEHEARCHLVDARNYGSHQALRVSSREAEASIPISGIAFSPSGQRLVVGMELEGIATFNVDSAVRRGFQHAQLN